LSALANKLSMTASRRYRHSLNIGLMEWRVLALLAVESPASPGRIAEVAGVDKSVVSRAVAAVEARGLVVVEAGEAGGRQTRLSLTPEGQAVHDRGIVGALAAEARLLEGFSEDERRLLVQLLKRLTSNVAQLSDESD
jgi:DNA-binding MarR family transcriptional regulator